MTESPRETEALHAPPRLFILGSVMSTLLLGIGAWLLVVDTPAMLVRVIGAVGVLGAIGMAYLSVWTARTPVIVIGATGFEHRAALLRRTERVDFAEITGVEVGQRGYTIVTRRQGAAVKIAEGSLRPADLERFVARCREHLVKAP